jgi:hypothetical protein
MQIAVATRTSRLPLAVMLTTRSLDSNLRSSFLPFVQRLLGHRDHSSMAEQESNKGDDETRARGGKQTFGSANLQHRLRSLCREFHDIFSSTVREHPAVVPPLSMSINKHRWANRRNRLPPRFLTSVSSRPSYMPVVHLDSYISRM